MFIKADTKNCMRSTATMLAEPQKQQLGTGGGNTLLPE
jgi:hypothetical protein